MLVDDIVTVSAADSEQQQQQGSDCLRPVPPAGRPRPASSRAVTVSCGHSSEHESSAARQLLRAEALPASMPPALPVAPYQLRPVMRGIAALGARPMDDRASHLARQSPAPQPPLPAHAPVPVPPSPRPQSSKPSLHISQCPPGVPLSLAYGSGMMAVGFPTTSPRTPLHQPRTEVSAPHRAQLPPGTSETPNSMEPSAGLELPQIRRGHASTSAFRIGDIARRTEKPEIIRGAVAFNERHREFVSSARGMLSMSGDTSGSAESHKAFRTSVVQLRRNRLVVEGKLQKLKIYEKRLEKYRRAERAWTWPGRIWEPRAQVGNSKGFYQTEAAVRTMLNLDWQNFLAPRASIFVPRATNAQADPDPVRSLHDVFLANHAMLMRAFDYYCILDAEMYDIDNELTNLHGNGMTQNVFKEFARDCSLACGKCTTTDLSLIWVACNAEIHDTRLTAGKLRAKEGLDHHKFMSRHEFIECVGRVAMQWHKDDLLSGSQTITGAVDDLCRHIEENLPPEAKQDSDAFRKKYCYVEGTDQELLKHEESLRNLFAVYARANNDVGSKYQSRQTMSLGEFITFINHIMLFEIGQLSLFGVKLIFKWSRMRGQASFGDGAIDAHRNMHFEDFCEALVRIAAAIALPTAAEMREANVRDAGEYLLALKEDTVGMSEFVAANKIGWWREPRQRVWDCLAHLMSYILRTIEETTSRVMHGPADFLIDDEEAIEFYEKRKGGAIVAPSASAAAVADGVAAARALVQMKLLKILKRVETFKDFTEDQLLELQGAMVLDEWKHRCMVVEQDTDGDEFFVIVEGNAEVLKVDHERNLIRINELKEGDYFGELALLETQQRLACVRVRSAVLMTMSITKARFEAAIGGTFGDVFAFAGRNKTLGLRWESVGNQRPEGGAEFANEALSEALKDRIELTEEELDSFGVYNLRHESFIKVGDAYYRPIGSGEL